MMLRVKRCDPIEIGNRWFVHGIYESEKGDEYFIWLRLPSWGMFWDIACDGPRWGQRVLLYRGRHGFSIQHYFPATF